MIAAAGKFVALEGGEGAGKSTQARLLVGALAAHGQTALLTREPGGTAGAEAIRALLLDTATDQTGGSWSMRAEALLFAAARADHVARLIRPALTQGSWVVCDRFVDSSRAYQGWGGGLDDDDILRLHTIGSEGLLPDLAILIEVAPETAAARLALRDGAITDRIGGRSAAYHAQVAAGFAQLAMQDAHRFARIDGNGSAAQTHRAVMAAVAPLLARQ